MNSIQYEEFCRFFLSRELDIPPDEIRSVNIPNPKRPGLPEYKHQIDLYWEIQDGFNLYLNIADAKWRNTQKVDKQDVTNLQYAKLKVAAHKAFMITNNEYTSGAIAVAKDEGIALHILKPNFDFSNLHNKNRSKILASLNSISMSSNDSIFIHAIINKAFDFREIKKDQIINQQYSGIYTSKVVSSYSHKAVTGGSNRDGSGDSSKTSGGFGGTTKNGGPGITK